jgi:hypothetical protein
MKSRNQGGDESWKRWYATRNRNLLEISGELPKNLCKDELNLTVTCRYAQSLLGNERVLRYLTKYHPVALGKLNHLFGEFEDVLQC